MQTSEVIYLGDLRTKGTHLASGEQLITDAPKDNNGKGEAFSPTDLMATSLAQCMFTIMGIEARKLEVDLVNATAKVTKHMGINPRRVVKIQIHITLPVAAKQYSQQLEYAAHQCPVAKSLHPDIEQQITFVYL